MPRGRRLLVTGAAGLLGNAVLERFREGWDGFPTDRPELDVTDPGACRRAVERFRPEVVIHCAAYTQVDRAETEEAEALALNAGGTENIARACRDFGALLVTYGTDYVFDGRKRNPYDEDDPPRPLSAYGRTKLAAEMALRSSGAEHLLIRTQWLFGPHGRNFVSAILEKAGREGILRVVSDQRGCPTFTRDLADGTARLIGAGARGTYHFSNEGEASFHEWARFSVSRAMRTPVPVIPLATRDLPPGAYPAPRPAYSVLSKERYARVTGHRPRDWREAVVEYLGESFPPREPRPGLEGGEGA